MPPMKARMKHHALKTPSLEKAMEVPRTTGRMLAVKNGVLISCSQTFKRPAIGRPRTASDMKDCSRKTPSSRLKDLRKSLYKEFAYWQTMAPNLTFGVAEELDLVEKRLRDCSLTEVETLTEIASYVVNSGGKRIRPIVTLLSFRVVGGEDVGKAINMATAIELIHTGSLIHDDINDGGELRRGRASALKKFGLEDSLVTGDFLFSKVLELGGQFGEEVILITADACSSLPSGEVLQRRFRFDTSITVDQYVGMTERKTARLISAGARSGALIGSGTPDQVQRLGEFGKNLGITFQIVDDILDVIGSEEKTGKKIGSDIREGNITLLSIYAMSNGSENSREELLGILKNDSKSEDDVARTLELIKEMGGPERAFQEASMYAKRAKEQISVFDNEYRDELEELVDYILNRES